MNLFTTYILSGLVLLLFSVGNDYRQETQTTRQKTAAATEEVVKSFMTPTITATKTDIISNDVAPLGLASPGDEITYLVEISNTGNMDATSVNFLDNLDVNTTLVGGSLVCSPVPLPDSYNVFGNVRINVPAGSGLLVNDQNPCNTGTLSVSAVNTSGTQGNVTVNPDGSFTFNPAAGFNGTTTFTYTVTNGTFAKTGTVTLNVSGRIWFIDNSQGTNGDGRLGTPFNSIANFNSGASGGSAGDIIFLYRQTASNYAGAGLTLKNNQYLIGQGASSGIAAITGITLPPHSQALPSTGGTNPIIAHNATAVTLGSGNQLHGFNVANTGGTGILGASVGNLKIRDLSVANSGGTALNFASGALDVIIKKLDASNATIGFALSSTTGSFTVEGTGTTDGSGGTIQTITQRGADIQTATNITLKNMTFTNANTADAGGLNTCDVNNTLACHGALYLRNITTVTLNNIDVNGAEEQGLNGNNISAMTMTDCIFTNCGDEQYEGSVKIRELSGTCSITNSTFSLAENELVEIFNTTATNTLNLSVIGCTFSNTFDKGFGAKGFYFSGTSSQTRNIVVDNCNFAELRSQGVYINASAGTLNVDVTDSNFSKGSKKFMDGVHILPQGSANVNINILRNIVTSAGGTAILVQGSGNAVFQARVNQNSVTGPNSCSDCVLGGGETPGCNCFGDAITVWATENSSGKANVMSNTISGIDDSGRGIYANTRDDADMNILISGNTVSVADDAWFAIDVVSGQPGTSQTSFLCAALIGNTINNTAVTPVFAHVRTRATTNVSPSTATLNVQGGASLAQVWDNNGNTPTTTSMAPNPPPPSLSFSTSGAGTENLNFNQTCSYTLTHPTALAAPEEELVATVETPAVSQLIQGNQPDDQASAQVETADIPDTPPSQALSMMDMVSVGPFTLPATTGSITIRFKATINTPFPQGVCQVSNQATVSGSNFSNVLTDDPDVAGSANPTVTQIFIAPTITDCQDNVITTTDDDLCTASVSFASTAVGCPAPTLTYKIGMTTITSPHNFPLGLTTVTVTASNGVSPDATCTFTVNVTDDQAPEITCLSGTQMRGTNMGNCTYTVQGTEFDPVVDENCPGYTLTNNFNNSSSLAGAALPLGPTSVVWTITDGALAQDQCTVTIQVSDDDAPTITCPPAASTPCNIADLPPYASLSEFTTAGGSATDNCGINTASFMLLSQTGGPLSYTRTYQIADVNGLTSTCTQTVTVNDNVDPTVTAGTIAACYPTVAAAEAAAIAATTATDNCPGTVTKTASTTGTCSAVITVTGTDGAGNDASVTYNTRIDNTAPTVIQGTIAACYPTVAAAEAAALAATSATDNCPGTLTETALTTGTCSATIVVTTTDQCGNSATATYTTSIDNASPTVTPGTIADCYPTVAAAEAAAIAATTANDDCPSQIVKTASTTGTCSAVVTVTATDACGNSASTTYNTRIDNTAPTVTQGTIAACYPTVAAAEAAALAATSATDNCPGALTESASTSGTCSAVVTVTTTDGCGNSASVTYNTRIDNTAPTVTAGTIAACYPTVAAAEAAALAATTTSDNCPGTVNKTASTVGTCSAVITVTGTDGCGNSASVTYNTRIDNTAPTVTAGTIAACYPTVAAAEAAAIAATTTSDNCPGTVNKTASTVGTCSAVITVTGTDGCGNSASVTYNTRIDNTAPTVTTGTIAACYPTVAAAEAAALAATSATDNCPGALTEIASTVGTCTAVVTVTTSDGCGNSTTVTYNTRIDNAGPTVTTGTIAACYPTVAAAEAAAIAATTANDDCPSSVSKTASTTGTCSAVITVTATDGCGNSASTTYNTRIDNTAPTVTQGTIAACYPTVAAAEAAALAATSATDNCPGALTEIASTSGTCSAVVTVTTTDGCGNSASVTYNTRIDNTAPTVTAGTIAACYPTVAAAEAAAIAATTTSDNCPGAVTKTASTVGTCSAVITVTGTDGCGNSASVTYNTRIDNTAPTVTAGTIASCYPTVAAAEAAAIAATTTSDNCPGAVTKTASTVGTCSAVITVTGTDGCGNSASVTYNTRIDNTAPTVTTGTIAACYPTVAAAQAAALAATSATDNCPGMLTETASTVGTCTAVVTVTTTDGCGNSTAVTYNTRIDNTGPTVTPGTIAACYPTVAAAEAAALAATTVVDDCLSTTTIVASTTGTCNAVVTVTATDGCGNSASASYNTRIDNTPPVVSCKNSTVTLNGDGVYTLVAGDVLNLGATSDNCGQYNVTMTPNTFTCANKNQTIAVTVTVSDLCGNSSTCTSQITVVEGTALPSGWSAGDVGTNAAGSSIYSPCINNGSFVLNAKGYTTNTTDVQHTVYQTLCGNAEIKARVSGLSPMGGWAGVQMRESSSQGSKKFTLKTQLSTILRREIRTSNFGVTNTLQMTVSPSHVWLRLVRSGSTFTAYSSPDGVNWTFRSAATIAMNSCIQVGLFVESFNNTTTTTATIDNVMISGGVAPLAGDFEGANTLPQAQAKVKVYPNPTNGLVMMDLTEIAGKQVRVQVFNAQGQQVEEMRLDEARELEQLDLSPYSEGVYWIRIQAEGMTPVTEKMIKSESVIRP